MRTLALIGLCLLLASPAKAEDKAKKTAHIVAGEYVVANCTHGTADAYGPEGHKVTVKIEGDEIVFHGVKEAAFHKTPRFKINKGQMEFKKGFYGTCGNLMITDVVHDASGHTIKCHACYIGDFELRKAAKKKDAKPER